MNLDIKNLEAKILHQPSIDTIKPNFNIQAIVEYYSR